MSRIVNESLHRFLNRMGATAAKAGSQDATYHYQSEFLRRMLEIADMAMEDEGVTEASRERVIRTIIYGGPNEVDAEQRIHAHEQMVKLIADTPTRSLLRECGM
jgi:hypothetical protein